MATRRSHRKSRNGCDQCKRRRIKCDEDHPCLNCSRRGMDCTFEHRSSATPPSSANDDFGILSDIRGCMRATNDAPCPRPSSKDSFRPRADASLYTPHVQNAGRPQMQETWQVVIPKVAYSYEFLMHGILGLSALHLACLKPERYNHYLAGAGFHMSLGLRSYRRILQSPSSDNCYALFCFSSLIMVYIYAYPTDPPESCRANGIDSIIELLKLCRGTLVLLPYFDRIRQSPLKQLFMREFTMDYANELSTFFQALDRLKASFICIENAPPPLECGMLYMWPLSVEEQFFTFLRQRHPVALVLLAFYCAQLRAFEDYWFVGRQGRLYNSTKSTT
ncbi:hypothetical protein BDV06DRAFT_213312 [Aspergillus oleicola]